MATQVRETLNAAYMDARVFCQGMAFVGVRVSGTFVGTLKPYYQQYDPTAAMWRPQGTKLYSWPGASAFMPGGSGTAVSSITAAGNYFWPVQNGMIFSLQMDSYTSGSAVVSLAAAIDNSWANAFLDVSGAAGQYRSIAVGGSPNTLTIPADTNLPRRLEWLVVSAGNLQGSGGSSNAPTTALWQNYPPLQIYDGTRETGTLIWSASLNSSIPLQYTVPLPGSNVDAVGIVDEGVISSPGNPITVFLSSPGSGVVTCLSAKVGY